MENIQTFFMEEEVFPLDDIDFWIKRLAKGKAKDIKIHQVEILKIGGPILIPHIHKIFNIEFKQGFLEPHCPYF